MKYDFATQPGPDLFHSVPAGEYACRVTDVRERLARDGSPRWNLRLEVIEGDHAGRTAGWDSITWSDRGVHRVQLVLCALGVDARGEVQLESSDLIGLEARVRFEEEEHEDPRTGRRQLRLRVPYNGFQPLDGAPFASGDRGDVDPSDGAIDAGGARDEPSGRGTADGDDEAPF